jgi:hypothetical protein
MGEGGGRTHDGTLGGGGGRDEGVDEGAGGGNCITQTL